MSQNRVAPFNWKEQDELKKHRFWTTDREGYWVFMALERMRYKNEHTNEVHRRWMVMLKCITGTHKYKVHMVTYEDFMSEWKMWNPDHRKYDARMRRVNSGQRPPKRDTNVVAIRNFTIDGHAFDSVGGLLRFDRQGVQRVGLEDEAHDVRLSYIRRQACSGRGYF